MNVHFGATVGCVICLFATVHIASEPAHALLVTVLIQAFAWFSDLLVEHADIFWSLFSVDMMAVLEQQPEDQWDSFPLFQLLNDYLREDGRSTTDPRTCTVFMCTM